MSILDIYKEKNKDTKWFNSHASLGVGSFGRMFEYTNTNFRNQGTFINDFLKFTEVENVPRNLWPKHPKHNQEIHKHYTVNMLQSKLFKRNKEGVFSRTTKGILYTDFISLDIPSSDRWLINYIFLLNGYYFNRKNYILSRVRDDLLGFLLSTDGIDKNLLISEAELLIGKNSFSEILRSDFFYFHSFYNDSDFLTTYLRSSLEEKEELATYIEDNLVSGVFQCCISKKYQRSGNFNKVSLLDETKVFLMTLALVEDKNIGLDNIYKKIFDFYDEKISVLKKDTLNYLYKNRNVFDPIFEDVLDVEVVDDSDVFSPLDISQIRKIDNEDVAEDYIDETVEFGKQKIKAIFNIRKKQARILSNYSCALEKVNNCDAIYFTAKTSGKNYLELHHFIPQEFRNDFPYSIEVLANYITLCPRCHRQIHLAVDRERKHLINAIYNDRSQRLQVVGLTVDLKKIYKYYKID